MNEMHENSCKFTEMYCVILIMAIWVMEVKGGTKNQKGFCPKHDHIFREKFTSKAWL